MASELARAGQERVEWADAGMPVLAQIRERWQAQKPLQGWRVSACLHVTTETANLMRTLAAGGAQVRLCASNPLSTQDDVVAALNEVYGIPTFARRGADTQEYYRHIELALEHGPQLTMDDGADLVVTLHTRLRHLLGEVRGGTEETTTGVMRLRAMARDGVLAYPIVAVNDARTKYLFDNRYGTGQSALDGLLRATNWLVAGSVVVVAGYGWCGRGIAWRARGLGARVVVTEVDPVRALEAVMDGFEVMPMLEAAARGDVFITATGNKGVLTQEHFLRMKDGAVLANAGHFNVEVDVQALEAMATERRRVRPHVDEYRLPGGKRLRLVGEGRLVNLAAAEGHPAQVMDMSFANQALALEWLVQEGGQVSPGVYPVPLPVDRRVAELKLQAMGLRIDRLRREQEEYLAAWQEGT
ncbi:MAG TPA: adenosylhomocysteinase [Limnochordales bacterium]